MIDPIEPARERLVRANVDAGDLAYVDHRQSDLRPSGASITLGLGRFDPNLALVPGVFGLVAIFSASAGGTPESAALLQVGLIGAAALGHLFLLWIHFLGD